MRNTIKLPNGVMLNVRKKHYPFKNSFKQLQPCERIEQHWHTFVELTGNMSGRILSVSYTVDGKLVGAHTVN